MVAEAKDVGELDRLADEIESAQSRESEADSAASGGPRTRNAMLRQLLNPLLPNRSNDAEPSKKRDKLQDHLIREFRRGIESDDW